jgi:hypothetical protein
MLVDSDSLQSIRTNMFLSLLIYAACVTDKKQINKYQCYNPRIDAKMGRKKLPHSRHLAAMRVIHTAYETADSYSSELARL